jgi:hypothetical protein
MTHRLESLFIALIVKYDGHPDINRDLTTLVSVALEFGLQEGYHVAQRHNLPHLDDSKLLLAIQRDTIDLLKTL